MSLFSHTTPNGVVEQIVAEHSKARCFLLNCSYDVTTSGFLAIERRGVCYAVRKEPTVHLNARKNDVEFAIQFDRSLL